MNPRKPGTLKKVKTPPESFTKADLECLVELARLGFQKLGPLATLEHFEALEKLESRSPARRFERMEEQ